MARRGMPRNFIKRFKFFLRIIGIRPKIMKNFIKLPILAGFIKFLALWKKNTIFLIVEIFGCRNFWRPSKIFLKLQAMTQNSQDYALQNANKNVNPFIKNRSRYVFYKCDNPGFSRIILKREWLGLLTLWGGGAW